MKIIALLLLLQVMLSAQIISETFSNFIRAYPDQDTTALKAFYVLDSLYAEDMGNTTYNMRTSLGPIGDTLYVAGWSDVADSYTALVSENDFYEGGRNIQFDSLGYFATDVLDRTDPLTSDFTLVCAFRFPDRSATISDILMCKGDGYGTGATPGWRFGTGGHTLAGGYGWDIQISACAPDSLPIINTTRHTMNTLVHRTEIIIWTFDRDDSLKMWKNGGFLERTMDISAFDDDSISNIARSFIIGAGSTGSQAGCYTDNIYYVKVFLRLLDEKEIAEEGLLAAGWSSKLGQVKRLGPNTESSWTFEQGFYDGDTIYYPLPDTAATGDSYYSLSLTARGGSAGDSLYCYIGTPSSIKGVLFAKELTGVDASYSGSLGAFPITSSDSLYFYTASGDTAYIDDINLGISAIGSVGSERTSWPSWKKR